MERSTRAAQGRIEEGKLYGPSEGVELLKSIAYAKFNETVDLSVNLNVNPRHADQMVRGSVSLPHGTGKSVRVAVFAKGEKATEATAAGADVVGDADLIERVQDGWLEFDTAVATPDMMGQVGRIGRVLGPRGLMPNPKTGTVTFDVAKIVGELKAGRVEFRVDKAGIIHIAFGKIQFGQEQLEANLDSVIEALARLRPASTRSPYFKQITIASSMSPAVALDTSFAMAKI